MYALANYNLGVYRFPPERYTQASNYFKRNTFNWRRRKCKRAAGACNRIGDCHLHVQYFEKKPNRSIHEAKTDE